MVNYNNGKIYRIEPTCDHDDGEIYIGSTTKTLLSQRMSNHRSNYKLWKEGKYNFTRSFALFEKYGVDNCEIVLIENIKNCKSKNNLNAREAYYIKTLQNVNRNIPLRTKSEYREDNKDHILQYGKQYGKQYREDNKKKLQKNAEQNKEFLYRKCLCDCGMSYTHHHKARHQRTMRHHMFIQNNPVV